MGYSLVVLGVRGYSRGERREDRGGGLCIMPPALPPCVGFSNEEERGIHGKDERHGKSAWCADWGKVRTPTDWPETGLVGVPALPQPTRYALFANDNSWRYGNNCHFIVIHRIPRKWPRKIICARMIITVRCII